MLYNIKFNGLGYPVGEDMQAAKEFAGAAAKMFKVLHKPQAVNIFCRGSSGAILASLFVAKLPKGYDAFVIHIKKQGESSHDSTSGLQRSKNGAVNVIIDDIISSGETLKQIYAAVKQRHEGFIVDCLIISNWSVGYIGNIKFTPVNVISR